MTLGYGYVKAKVISTPVLKGTRGHNKHTHETQYHLHCDLDVGGKTWDVAINVGTSDSDDLLKYKLVFDYKHALIQALAVAPPGSTDLTASNTLPSLDFQRSDVLDNTGPWRDSGIMDGSADVEPAASLIRILSKAQTDGHYIYLFGRFYIGGDLGIHDTHMNQGSTGSYIHDAGNDHNDHNDIWQDGALLVDMGEPEWIGYFSVFNQQKLPTDELGNPTADASPVSNR